MSSSSVTLFCAHASGAKQIIASATKTHFFIFVSNRLALANPPAGAQRDAQSRSSAHPADRKSSAHNPVPAKQNRLDHQSRFVRSNRNPAQNSACLSTTSSPRRHQAAAQER